MIFNVTTGGGGTVSVGAWRFTTATAKPATVSKRTMVAITATTPTTLTVSDAAPANPAANDIWFHVENPETGRAMSDGSVPIMCWGAYKYVSSAWTLVTAYYAFLDNWWELPGLPSVGTPLANCSWAQIDRIGKAGKAADYFCIGDEKTITLSTSEVLTLQILGFAHDDLAAAGGGKAPITFGFKNCMNTKLAVNNPATNVGGYAASDLYAAINGSIKGSLPADLAAVMKNVNKLTSGGGTLSTIVTTQETLFLLSEVEVTGASAQSHAGQGTRYAFFTGGGSMIKTVSGTSSDWWLRSPNKSTATTNTWNYFKTTGTVQYVAANTLNGIVLALCV